MKKSLHLHTRFAPLSFAMNILMAYIIYFVCRVAYCLENADAFSFEGASLWLMMKGSLVFDTSAILYTNALYALMMLLPLRLGGGGFASCWKRVAKWVFVVVNSICCYINLGDAAYFRFTGRRTTCSVFQEFGNENNLTGIFLTEFARHWYLVILGIVITIALIKLYVDTDEKPLSGGKKWRYYFCRVVCLLVFLPLCIGGMRGGLSHAVRPVTISNANQYVESPSEAALILNTPFSMLRTMSKKSFVDPKYMSAEEMNAAYSPLHKLSSVDSQPSTLQRKNIVLLIVESFGREYIGALNKTLDDGKYKGYTPFVDSLIESSLTFPHSFANGRKSIDGMPSILSSIPMFVEPFFLTPSSMNDVSGIAGELSKEGYYSAFFHGAENGSMGFEAFAKATGFEAYFGRTEYNKDKRFNGDKDYDGIWAIWDEPFLQYFALTMNTFREPFVTAVFTASSHHPFNVPEDSGYKDTDSNPIHKCIRYTDHALERFFETASQQPWFDNTIFVLTSDHTNISDHDIYQSDLGVYAAPIIIYDPSGGIEPGVSPVVAQQIDIMPTLLSHLGYSHPYVAFGKDLLSVGEGDSWAVNYNNGLYQYITDDYLIQFDGTCIKSVYRYNDDPLLKQNIAEKVKNDKSVKSAELRLKAIIQSYMQRMINNELTVK